MLALLALPLLVLLVSPAWATDYGFDFRNTSGFVTDSAPNQYVVGYADGDSYPQTRGGITFGFESSCTESRNRDSGVDARFAGMVFNASSPCLFRVDLPSTGAWTVRASFGDNGNGASNLYAELREGSTAFATIGPTSIAGNHFLDATGVDRTSISNWISSNASVSHTFSTTTFRVSLGDGTNTGMITHLLLSPVGATTKLQTKNSNGKLFTITSGTGKLQVK